MMPSVPGGSRLRLALFVQGDTSGVTYQRRWSQLRTRATLAAASALTATVVAGGAFLDASGPRAQDKAGQGPEGAQATSEKPRRRAPAATKSPNAIGFWSKHRGLVGTGDVFSRNGGRLLLTTDGGKSFQVVARSDSGVVWIDTAGTENAWALTQGPRERRQLLRSKDGGRTWKSVSRDPLIAPSFADSSDGLAMYGGGPQSKRLVITHDGGKSWSRAGTPCSDRLGDGSAVAGAMVAMATTTDALAVCVGEGSTGLQPKEIARTEDGARTWETVTDDTSCNGSAGICRVGFAHAITVDSSGAGALTVGGYPAYLTWDWGRTWSHRRTGRWPGFATTLRAQPVSRSAVFALVFGGRSEYRLIFTDDRGKHWRLMHSWRKAE